MAESSLPDYRHNLSIKPCTMTGSNSSAPSTSQWVVESLPTKTIIPKSSFSEIEQAGKGRRSLTPHSLIPLKLQVHQVMEPFVSPLTETNLNYLNSTFPSSREAKTHHVNSFIRSQRTLLEQEQELQRKTKAEIRSMIPLDTASIEEELVRDDFQHKQRLSTTLTDFNSHQHRCYSTITQSCGSNNDDQERSNLIFGITCNERDDYSIHQLDHSSSSSRLKRSLSRRHWKKFFTRWISTGHDKKTGKPGDKDNDRQHSPTETAEPIIHPTGASTSQPQENNQTNSATIDTLPDRENDQRQTRKPARHVSWSVGTSYEEYKRQKANMVEQGLYGLSNANIARALGGSHRGSKASLLFRPELTSSQTSNPSTPTPQANTSEATGSLATKPKDSGLLFVQQTLLSTKSLLRPRKSARWKGEPNDNDDNTEGGINRRRNSTDHGRDSLQGSRQPSQRRRSTHIMERYSPKLSALEEEDIHGVPCPTLVAFRYPKMVRMKDLRDAAIHILSVTDEDGIDTGQRGANSSGDGDRYKQKV